MILLHNARIFGSDGDYILIKDGRIEKIGCGALPDASRKIDMSGAEIIPGFCDSHTHLENIAMMHETIDLTGLSKEELMNVVMAECKKKKMVIGRGWDESTWKDKNIPTGKELDSLCPGKIVMLIREDGHMAVINGKAAERCGVVADEGVVREEALAACIKKLDVFSSLDFEYAQQYAIERGVTCVHDFATPGTLKAYFAMHAAGRLRIRIYASFYEDSYSDIKSLGLRSGFGDSFLRIGALKLFADGSIGAGTAATIYRDGRKVKPMLTAKNLGKIVKDANSNGIRVFTHAIGDLAIREVMRAYAGTRNNRIEHLEMPENENLVAGQEVSMQPNFLKWAKPGGLYHSKLEDNWRSQNNPYRKIIDSGMNVLFGSDCMPLDPIYGIELATSSDYDSQRISRVDAIKLYTIGAKYMHNRLGVIKEGNIADLAVLKNNKVVMTIINGKIEYFNNHLFSQELL